MCMNYYQSKIDENSSIVFGNISIRMRKRKEKFSGFIIRKLIVMRNNQEE